MSIHNFLNPGKPGPGELRGGRREMLAQLPAESFICGLLELGCDHDQIDPVELMRKPTWAWSGEGPPQPEFRAAPFIDEPACVAAYDDNALR